jgi:hypothetical protein
VPGRFLDSLDNIEFLGEIFKVPHDPEGFLRNMYGRTWRVPLVNRQSRKGWGHRIKKVLRNPLKLFFYMHRYVTRHAYWSKIAKKSERAGRGKD